MIKKLLIFMSGAATGSILTYYISKKKFQKMMNEQINSVKTSMKEYYEKKYEFLDPKDPGISNEVNEEKDDGIDQKPSEMFRPTNPTEVLGSNPIVSIKNKANETVMKPKEHETPDAVDTLDGYPDPSDETAKPYLIKDDDFGIVFDDECNWIIWKDGIVTNNDDRCEPIKPDVVKAYLPENWESKFGWDKSGDYDNELYFRNNVKKVDICIVKGSRTYREWKREAYPSMMYEEDDDE